MSCAGILALESREGLFVYIYVKRGLQSQWLELRRQRIQERRLHRQVHSSAPFHSKREPYQLVLIVSKDPRGWDGSCLNDISTAVLQTLFFLFLEIAPASLFPRPSTIPIILQLQPVPAQTKLIKPRQFPTFPPGTRPFQQPLIFFQPHQTPPEATKCIYPP